jgi:formylglycine-generating enzyme required for sulfatase activity
MNEPIKVFLSYSHEDEDLRKELISHLSGLQHQGLIEPWHDRNISAGSEWADQIDQNLEQADIILFLVSADFINSRYCYSIEMKRALERHRAKTACTIPVIIRDCDWKSTDLHQLNGIPRDNRHVAGWGDRYARDSAWRQVSEEIGKVARQIWEARNTQITAEQKAQAKQAFRAKVEIFYVDGVMSPTEQRLLNRAQQELGLEESEAEEILRVVATAYQQHQADLEEYRQTLIDELAGQDELRDDQRVLLQQLQAELKISDPEADRIEREVWTDRALVPQPVQESPDSQAQMLAQQNPAAAVERNDDRDGGGERFLKAMSEFLGSEKAQEIHTKVLEKRQKESENRRKNQEFAPNRTNLNLQTFSFEVVLLDDAGKERKRTTEQAHYFAEVLAPGLDLHMVSIPGGSFQMGSPDGEGDDNEHPQHLVSIAPFFMGKFPVTQAQWRVVSYYPKVNIDLPKDPSSPGGNERDRLPVDSVYWEWAVEFCNRLSHKTKRIYRLPSEAEWEYACRAGTKTKYHFGDKIRKKYVCYSNNLATTYFASVFNHNTSAVGIFNVANNFGLYDMHGNVWEWCLDKWHDNYHGAPKDGSTWIAENKIEHHVLRGGSFLNSSGDGRSARRLRYHPNNIWCLPGFRVMFVP